MTTIPYDCDETDLDSMQSNLFPASFVSALLAVSTTAAEAKVSPDWSATADLTMSAEALSWVVGSHGMLGEGAAQGSMESSATQSADDIAEVRDDVSRWQRASAASFWAFEDSLPDEA